MTNLTLRNDFEFVSVSFVTVLVFTHKITCTVFD